MTEMQMMLLILISVDLGILLLVLRLKGTENKLISLGNNTLFTIVGMANRTNRITTQIRKRDEKLLREIHKVIPNIDARHLQLVDEISTGNKLQLSVSKWIQGATNAVNALNNRVDEQKVILNSVRKSQKDTEIALSLLKTISEAAKSIKKAK